MYEQLDLLGSDDQPLPPPMGITSSPRSGSIPRMILIVSVLIVIAVADLSAMAEKLSAATIQLGERVRTRRQELGLNREELAARAKVHWTYVGQVERGERNLSLRNITRLAAALDEDPSALVAGLPAW